ncbi:MAG: acyl-CoA thioesterase [Lentisphaerae bacterium]|jgi:acyl-CoA hydrolase|nr:acyl-CoA thioesterase [Lentisphaerota bacterium]
MDFYTLVRPEHLNHYNYLFGGVLLQWIDEFAYIAAIRQFPAARFVTRAMDKVSFHKSVNNGALLRFQVTRERLGTTSVSYRVQVWGRDFQEIQENEVFETVVTMVSVDPDGKKTPLPQDCVTE